MGFRNENIINEQSKPGKRILLSIILIIISIAVIVWGTKETDKALENVKDLNYIIENEDKKDDLDTYLEIKRAPYLFAYYDDRDDAYYFVTDGKYLYIAYMSEEEYNNIYDEDKVSEFYRISGVSKIPPKDVKEIAIDSYNKMYELSEEEKLTLADFNNYFGDVYIDTTQSVSSAGMWQYLIGIVLLVGAFITFIYNIIKKVAFNKSIKKFNRNDILKIDEELRDKESFYYQSLKLYLTKSYIVNFNYKVEAIKYEDVLWMYSFIQRTNGVKTNQSIIVKDKNGKTHNIANINVITKAKQEQYEEIFNLISSKNKEMLVGYTKDNIQKYKNMIKR